MTLSANLDIIRLRRRRHGRPATSERWNQVPLVIKKGKGEHAELSPHSLEMFATAGIVINGRLGSLEKLQASIADSASIHDAKIVFQTTSNERLYLLHRSTLEKAVDGDLTKIRQLLKAEKP